MDTGGEDARAIKESLIDGQAACVNTCVSSMRETAASSGEVAAIRQVKVFRFSGKLCVLCLLRSSEYTRA